MKVNIILEKTFNFSLEIIKIYNLLVLKKEFVMSKQLLRSGTSIGANIHEAQGSISRREFIAKVQISHKELLETDYWLRLLKQSGYFNDVLLRSVDDDLLELKKILTTILNTSKNS
ncbi:MAG: four helix bundle protein [Candidatus Dojkabacteria bacterium]